MTFKEGDLVIFNEASRSKTLPLNLYKIKEIVITPEMTKAKLSPSIKGNHTIMEYFARLSDIQYPTEQELAEIIARKISQEGVL